MNIDEVAQEICSRPCAETEQAIAAALREMRAECGKAADRWVREHKGMVLSSVGPRTLSDVISKVGEPE